MEIKIKSIILTNFKGIKSQVINFDTKATGVYGANEAGKTTIFDAFSWLLFGKDSQDRKDFNIKNTKQIELNRQEHQVQGILLIDGEEVSIKRIYKEKWTRKKGQTISEMTGNIQEFYFNDVPLQAGEFAAKIAKYVEETVFKLITNPLYFNTLNWTKRRDFLFKLAGEISDSEVAFNNPDFELLLNSLKTKSLAEFKKEISAKKKLLKDDLEAYPHRIDEVSRSLPQEQDWTTIEAMIKQCESILLDYDILISDVSKANKNHLESISEKQNELHTTKSKIKDLEYNAETDFRTKQNNLCKEYSKALSTLENALEEVKRNLNSKTISAKTLSEKNDGLMLRKKSLLDMFNSTNESELVFREGEFLCPTCKRDFDIKDIDEKKKELHKNFMLDKNKALDEIEAKGLDLKKEIETNDDLIKSFNKVIDQLNIELSAAEKNLTSFYSSSKAPEEKEFNLIENFKGNVEYDELVSKAAVLVNELENANPELPDNSDLLNKKKETSSLLDISKNKSKDKESIEKGNKRIQELKNQEAATSQQLADLEASEFTIDAFNKAKIEAVESRINDKFQYVNFKMYDYTIEGNPFETCDTLYKGVPFSDLNTAGKIWAGLDIINTLSSHYNVSAPVFLDNRESVSAIPFTQSQVINLYVSPEDKELRVVA